MLDSHYFDQLTIDWVTTSIATAIGSLTSYLFAIRRNIADARKSELENIEQAIKLWRETAQHQQVEIENLRAQVNGLYAKVTELLQENTSLREEIAKLKEDNLDNQTHNNG